MYYCIPLYNNDNNSTERPVDNNTVTVSLQTHQCLNGTLPEASVNARMNM